MLTRGGGIEVNVSKQLPILENPHQQDSLESSNNEPWPSEYTKFILLRPTASPLSKLKLPDCSILDSGKPIR
jgi:hypothetical protein